MTQPDRPPAKTWPIAVAGLATFLVGHIVNSNDSNGSGSALILVGVVVLAVAAILKLRQPRARR